MEKILCEKYFNNLKLQDIGYIIVEDKPTSNIKIHKILCNHIKIESFREKVILNKSKNGSYYWIKDINFVDSKFKIQLQYCSKCF